MYLQEVGRGGCVDWIDLSQNGEKWWVFVNVVIIHVLR